MSVGKHVASDKTTPDESVVRALALITVEIAGNECRGLPRRALAVPCFYLETPLASNPLNSMPNHQVPHPHRICGAKLERNLILATNYYYMLVTHNRLCEPATINRSSIKDYFVVSSLYFVEELSFVTGKFAANNKFESSSSIPA